MNSISGMSGHDPQAMMQKMQERMQQADTDNNGALSKSEITTSMEEAGHLPGNFDKMFDKMDSDGDGQLSQEEQQSMQENMQRRMEQFQSMGAGNGVNVTGYQQGNNFQSLLDSLDSDDEQDNQLKSALEQVQNGNTTETQQDPWQVLNDKIPPINTYA